MERVQHTEPPGTDEAAAAEPAKLTAGQRLVASLRAQRITRRTGLQTALKFSRDDLRRERLARLGLATKVPQETVFAAPAADETPAPAPDIPRESMFAHLVTTAEAPTAEPIAMPDQLAPAATEPPEAVTASPAASAMPSPPVGALGFGPGMVTRFHQIGIETIADLAGADAAYLRDALGDVSRLINVDAWIATARSRPDEEKPSPAAQAMQAAE